MRPRHGLHDQAGFGLRFDWGPVGAAVLAASADVVIIVDVLSFSTAVEIAVSRGATVIPVPSGDHQATEAAVALGAVHAVGYGALSPGQPSIAPSSLLDLAAGTRLVMPSPNGAAITSGIAGRNATILAGCLRNATAIARAAGSIGRQVAIIAAGERWPDRSLRPASEDLLAAGMIIGHLHRAGVGSPSPEARAAAMAANVADLRSHLRACVSGRELIARGFLRDVDLAAEVDASTAVPILHQGELIAYHAPEPDPRA